MKAKSLIIICVLLVLMLVSIACALFPESLTPANQSLPSTSKQIDPTLVPASCDADQGTVLIVGDFEYSNDFVLETYYLEHAVALLDLTGFVKRDMEWELPVISQVLGYMEVDRKNNRGTFRLQLPARPAGIMNDVDNDSQSESGVQIFAVGYSPNLYGDPFSAGDDRSIGWPSYLASVITDRENKDEITGGKLIVWAADDQQEFPASFGKDGLLFTSDDPVAPLPAGYSVVDLDQTPFNIIRDEQVSLKLYEPADVAVKDFSNLSYSLAFERMFSIVRKEYAFNGIREKQPDWDALYSQVAPKVLEAEKRNDRRLLFLALREFTDAFKDGHVGLNGGDVGRRVFFEEAGNGYGMSLRELDNGQVVVVYIQPQGPADLAGIRVGAEVTSFNGQPIQEAIASVKPLFGPYSTDWAYRYDQVLFLTRAPNGAQAEVTFTNPGQTKPTTVTLKSVQELDSLFAADIFSDDTPLLPVTFEYLPSGVGYIRLNSNYDDLNLVIRLFERALKTFSEDEAPGIIIDVRQNSGGANLGLAGFLYDKDIIMGQLEYYSEKTGKFEPEGPREKIRPNSNQYRFKKSVLLVGPACFSACELEAYGFSQVPGMIIMGMYPTGGVEAEVARGKFELPAGMSITVPTGRYTLPDGSIFIEGVGVQPTQRIPITYENVLSDQDAVLLAAEQAILKP
ncbi:MAG: peptidase S41 [Anaerolineae bacterium]|nr:peptidase S41 [Anaerolineae bacterium]